MSAFPALFLLFDGSIKLLRIPPVVESFARLGYPTELAPTLGAMELVCLALYLLPRTATLGALLWTGYLGGAISTHLRVGDPLFSHTLFPLYVAALLWLGLYLRDDRARTFFATSKSNPGDAR
ncbi:MAG: DoxX family protein [Polyangiaceae bacterium]|nr:DoxX family protein [Polyangiaceae bacterium]